MLHILSEGCALRWQGPYSVGVWVKAEKGNQLGPGEAGLEVRQGLPSPLQACYCCLRLKATFPEGLLWSPRQGASPCPKMGLGA